MDRGKMLTTATVAERLGVKVVTVQRWLKERRLAGINIGGRAGWRVPESAVEAFIAGQPQPDLTDPDVWRTRRAEGE